MSTQQRNASDDGDFGDADHLVERRSDDPLLGRALALVRHLRRHCPWDARQTPRTLVPYLLEEADETADAILRDDVAGLRDELGDLLLNLAFQIVLAEERGDFATSEVVSRLERKMRVRHPHVYGDAEAPPDWEETKRSLDHGESAEPEDGGAGPSSERGGARPTSEDAGDASPRPGTPLSEARRTQARAARVGFDWPEAGGALEKLREEADELATLLTGAGAAATGDAPPEGAAGRPGEGTGDDAPEEAIREEVGDLLFAAVNVARLSGVDPDEALGDATGKFRARFRRLLRLAERRGTDPVEADLDALEALWREVKAGE